MQNWTRMTRNTITIFPIQAHHPPWTWDRLAAIGLFAVPVWLVLHVGLMPVRNR